MRLKSKFLRVKICVCANFVVISTSSPIEWGPFESTFAICSPCLNFEMFLGSLTTLCLADYINHLMQAWLLQ